MDFSKQRNNDLMRVYRQCLAEARVVVMPEIFQRVADSPSRRFWVSEERAAIVVARIHAGKSWPHMRPAKREMFEEIYRRFLIERMAHPKKSVYELVTGVVNQPAPKFYLTARTVGEFIYRIKNGWYEKAYGRYGEKPCR